MEYFVGFTGKTAELYKHVEAVEAEVAGVGVKLLSFELTHEVRGRIDVYLNGDFAGEIPGNEAAQLTPERVLEVAGIAKEGSLESSLGVSYGPNAVEVAQVVIIDIKEIYGETAKLALLPEYEAAAVALAGNGADVTLTGGGPVWLYLRLAHALHGKCRSLHYDSPVTGSVVVFDHNPTED